MNSTILFGDAMDFFVGLWIALLFAIPIVSIGAAILSGKLKPIDAIVLGAVALVLLYFALYMLCGWGEPPVSHLGIGGG
jgi:hypothetical protein